MDESPPKDSVTKNVVVGGGDGVIIQSGTHTGDITIVQPEPKPIVPRQLPGAARHFVGRAAELDRLSALLDAVDQGTVVISAVDGTAGIGKSALAIHWANQSKDRFPDGHLYINLGGYTAVGEPIPGAIAVRAFLDALEVPAARIPADLAEQAALYRSLVADRRMLVVLDNARDSAHVRPLLPGGDRCMVLVTSRSRLSALVAEFGAERVTLDLLDLAQALDLLAARIGAARLEAEPDAAAALVKVCAHLPLALAIAAARIAERPHHTVADLVTELRDEQTRLDGFDLGELDVNLRAVFSWSYRALPTATARLFGLLGRHPGPDIGLPAVAALGGMPPRQAQSLMDQLVRANLIEEHAAGRYRFHDLLRVYARECADERESADALVRVAGFYLHTSLDADHQLYPQREAIAPAPSDGVQPLDVADYAGAMDWFTTEYACLIAVIKYAAATGLDTFAWQLPWAMHTFMDRQGHWYDSVANHEAAIAATERLGDGRAQARIRYNLGHAYAQRERYPQALAEIERARKLFVALGIRDGEAHVYHSMSWILARESRLAEGLERAEQALALQREVGNRFGEAEALNTVAWLAGLLGDHERDLEYGLAAMEMFRELGHGHHEALALSGIATAYHRLGRDAEAVDPQERAVDLLHDIGMPYEEAVALLSLGDTYLALHDVDAAATAWRRAESVFTLLGQSKAEEARERLAGLPADG